eukprot:1328349-Amorphochlora_amoeboformis.AAC.2
MRSNRYLSRAIQGRKFSFELFLRASAGLRGVCGCGCHLGVQVVSIGYTWGLVLRNSFAWIAAAPFHFAWFYRARCCWDDGFGDSTFPAPFLADSAFAFNS